ncbi:MAG: septum formation initiator family protein [Clostridia bacterium]|nr:septum formation initiator family protein [Clostridia bacterium]
MTEAAFKKKKNTQAASGERISTHPSYTEYSWDSIVADNSAAQTAQMSAEAIRRPAAAQSATAVRRPTPTAQPRSRVDTRERKEATSGKAARTAANRQAAMVQGGAAVKKRTKAVVNIHTLTVEKKYAFPMSIVLIALCFTILVMSIVTTLVQVSDITAENSALKSQYNSLVSQENELRLLLETRDDLRVVEAMAKEELGMVKKDQVDRYYLTVNKEDRIEIVEEVEESDGGFIEDIMTFGGSLVERIRNFFGM